LPLLEQRSWAKSPAEPQLDHLAPRYKFTAQQLLHCNCSAICKNFASNTRYWPAGEEG